MSSDLEFVTTEDLIEELCSRCRDIVIMYEAKNHPDVYRRRREGSSVAVIGMMESYKVDLINELNDTERELTEPDDPA